MSFPKILKLWHQWRNSDFKIRNIRNSYKNKAHIIFLIGDVTQSKETVYVISMIGYVLFKMKLDVKIINLVVCYDTK